MPVKRLRVSYKSSPRPAPAELEKLGLREIEDYKLGSFLIVEPIDGRIDASLVTKIDYILMRIRQRLLEVPIGVDITTFIEHDGKMPAAEQRSTTISFADLRQRYIDTVSKGSLETSTLTTSKIHLEHLAKTIGEKFSMDKLGLADLQRHVDCRQNRVSGVTIKKEINTLRALWNWACRMRLAHGVFPAAGLVYPKGDEKLPFMNFAEIERRIKAGGDPNELWECLYLTDDDIHELLDEVQSRDIRDWIYPAFALAAHTGARRSEIMRARPEDVDLAGGMITIREKKRVKGRRTTRRVPFSARLAAALQSFMNERAATVTLFSSEAGELLPQDMQSAFEHAVKGSRWQKMRGWHVLRHSFISALASKGVDQRLIDDFVGHQTEEQRRRYRHLYPSTQHEAIRTVFDRCAND